ncbi:hypothetical protein RB195_003136 [Necator americanus]|uniref:Reverse transcriptase domain-containing protein n=1 Tax=Necator americanus TaxID=51031 RepID=A0ABR1DM64_NECAM
MDLVDPATEEERACFGVIRPVRSSLSRTRRSKNISDTVDRVIAGCEEFVTQDEIMRGLDTAFEKLSVVPALRIPTTLENAMRKLEWDDMGVKVDGRQLHHLRFADDIVLITPSISQA